MIPLIGYGDRLSGRPGDTIEFKVSSISAEPFSVALYRSISADPNPAGPGIIERRVHSAMDGEYLSRLQPFHAGSYAISDEDLSVTANGFTLRATIWPTLPEKGEQAILSCGGIILFSDDNGTISGRAGELHVAASKPLKTRTWYRVWLTYDADEGTLTTGYEPLKRSHGAQSTIKASNLVLNGRPVIGALEENGIRAHFNGKIEAHILSRPVCSRHSPRRTVNDSSV